jgi:hypothetical protein
MQCGVYGFETTLSVNSSLVMPQLITCFSHTFARPTFHVYLTFSSSTFLQAAKASSKHGTALPGVCFATAPAAGRELGLWTVKHTFTRQSSAADFDVCVLPLRTIFNQI